MTTELTSIRFPELVFGIAGPIGVEIDQISGALSHALNQLRYDVRKIKLTSEMMSVDIEIDKPDENDFYSEVTYKMDYANAIRAGEEDAAYMARLAINAIKRERVEVLRTRKLPEDSVPENVAYIIRQLKRPEEVALLRQVYGRQFVLLSAYGSERLRKALIKRRVKSELPSRCAGHIIASKVETLLERDADEGKLYGQRLRDTFHLADVFVDGINKKETENKTDRFIHALFGKNDIAPSREEYGMYAATSASLRSSDLSRQVGAAIFSPDGELVTQGCNEVPKAFGGTYWDLETPDHRDIKMGRDPNDALKKDILRDLFERLKESEMLSDKANSLGTPTDIAERLTQKARPKDGPDAEDGPLASALVMDLTEYGRIVHAEMSAICDAARVGHRLKGSTLYCTTFPCHNCTKHILAAGLKKVVYIEPYPKSRAKDLHENEIEIEDLSDIRVSYMPFLGISPFRYRDIFQKGKRKDEGGKARQWFHGVPRPMIEIASPSYTGNEDIALVSVYAKKVETRN